MRVLKFGGSSVANSTSLRQVAQIVAQHRKHDHVVVVTSAMRGVTDDLIALTNHALAGDDAWHSELDAIIQRHADIYHEFTDAVPIYLAAYHAGIARRITEIVQSPAPVTQWTILECSGWGERLAVPLITAVLASQHISAVACITEPVILSEKINVATIQQPEASILATRAWLAPQLTSHLRNGDVCVLPGYIARDPHGRATVLGRNGSDYSAATIAAALGAHSITIYSDVAGIYTADPHRNPSATLLTHLSYDEATAIAQSGAKVLHPRTVTPLARHAIPLHLRSTFAPEEQGTDILPEDVPIVAQ